MVMLLLLHRVITLAVADNDHTVNLFVINVFGVDVVDGNGPNGNTINPVAYQWRFCQIFAKILSVLKLLLSMVCYKSCCFADNGWCRQYCRCHRCCQKKLYVNDIAGICNVVAIDFYTCLNVCKFTCRHYLETRKQYWNGILTMSEGGGGQPHRVSFPRDRMIYNLSGWVN